MIDDFYDCDRVKFFTLLTAFIIFGMNLRFMAPTITAGDSAELSLAQTVYGIAHSPGYPFFVLTGKCFSFLMPFGNPAYKTNLFSVFCSFASGGLCLLIFLFFTNSLVLPIVSTLLLFSVPVIREQFMTTEVFALNMLMISGIIYLVMLLCRQEENINSEKTLMLIVFFLGLGLGNQHTLILLFPSLIFIAVLFYKKAHWDRQFFKSALLLSLFFLMGISVYAFLPLRSLKEPLLDWEDPQTFERFWGVVTRARYGMFQLAQGEMADFSLISFLKKISFFAKEIVRQFTLPLSAFLVFGIFVAISKRKSRRMGIALFLVVFFSGPFFLMLSNVSTASGHGILSRFLPMPFMAFFIAGIIGCSSLGINVFMTIIMPLFFFFLPSTQSMRNHFMVYDYGINALRTLPENSVLFADRADELEFSLAYLLNAESRRKDISYTDCNAGVSRSIYGDDYYKIWGKPRLVRREMKEKEILVKSDKEVFYATNEPGMLPIPKISYGMMYRAKPDVPDCVDWKEIYTLRYDFFSPGFREKDLFFSYAYLMGTYYLDCRQDVKSEKYFEMLGFMESRWNHNAALLFLKKGDYFFAEKFFKKAVLRDPEPDKIFCNMGLMYENQNKMGDAEACYHKAVRINPQSAQAHYNLGVLHWKFNRWRDVVREFESVLKIDPQHVDASRYCEIAKRRLHGKN